MIDRELAEMRRTMATLNSMMGKGAMGKGMAGKGMDHLRGKGGFQGVCFACGKPGHKRDSCPEERRLISILRFQKKSSSGLRMFVKQ